MAQAKTMSLDDKLTIGMKAIELKKQGKIEEPKIGVVDPLIAIFGKKKQKKALGD